MFKLLLVSALLAATTIDATRSLKKPSKLETSLASESTHRVLDHVRRRRDAAEVESEELTSAEELPAAASFKKFLLASGWQDEKLKILSKFLDLMSDTDNNMTLIGWQRVLDDEGEVKKIGTIQLVIPPKPADPDAPSNVVEDEEEEEEGRLLPHDDIEKANELFAYLDLGAPASITAEEFDKEGNNTSLVYLERGETYAFDDNIAIYNKTVSASEQQLADFIEKLKPAALGEPSVLEYDVDGNLLPDQSHIKPQILGYVLEHDDAPYKILREAPGIIARISQQYSKAEIPRQLRLHYNRAYREYKWRVLVDPERYYITSDVFVVLTYDNFDFDETSDITYLVYGVKR